MKNILICPLDWGMGHATRVRQLAHRLHQDGHFVTIAASQPLLKLFDDTVCSEKIVFTSLPVKYSSRHPQYIAVLLQAPFIFLQFLSDHFRIGRMVKRLKIDILISDNRFGAWSRKAFSIYITHQLTIKVPGKDGLFSRLLSRIHRLIASKYDECWIPDIQDGLAGDLTIHRGLKNTRFIGVLTMLSTVDAIKPPQMPEYEYHAVIISGPEPQRTILEQLLVSHLERSMDNFVFAGGNLLSSNQYSGSRNIIHYNCLSPAEIKYVLLNCKGVICRGGYSTLMDLAFLGKGGIVIPTPGQTEQEYLAHYLDQKSWFKYLRQDQLGKLDVNDIPQASGFDNINRESAKLFELALDGLIRRSSSRQK